MSQFELRIPSKLRGATRPSHLRLLRTRPSFPALWDERDATSAGFTTVDAADEYAFKSTEFKVARIINNTHFFQTHNEPKYHQGWWVTFVMWGSRRRVQETQLSARPSWSRSSGNETQLENKVTVTIIIHILRMCLRIFINDDENTRLSVFVALAANVNSEYVWWYCFV